MHAQVKIATRPAPRRGLFGRGCGSAAARSEGHLPLEREVEDAGEQQLTALSTSPLSKKKNTTRPITHCIVIVINFSRETTPSAAL